MSGYDDDPSDGRPLTVGRSGGSSAPSGLPQAAAVVIGRNLGKHLEPSLLSALDSCQPVVYVDSGSTDGSSAVAQDLGCIVVNLDSSRPFTAARARSEGLARVVAVAPRARFVQFLDGDAVLSPGWPAHAVRVLDATPDACAVIGRLREAHPEKSIYNHICELEWNLPIGDVHCFGGIAMLRIEALVAVGGFNASLIAGEEPELAQRLRAAGWRIVSVAAPMGIHDAEITEFRQWMRRAYRTGHAYAEICWMGRGLRGRFGLRQSMRIWGWTAAVPLVGIGATLLDHRAAWLLLGLYAAQMARIALGVIRLGQGWRVAMFYALTWLPSLGAQWLGQLRFVLGLVTNRRSKLVEYKRTSGSAAPPERSGT